MCPDLGLPSVVHAADGRRMSEAVDPRYISHEEVQVMRSPHAETRHLLCILMSVIRNPGQRPESQARKVWAAVVLRDLLNAGTQLRNIPSLAAMVFDQQAVLLQHGRLRLQGSTFTRCQAWPSFHRWWNNVLQGRETLAFPLLQNDVFEHEFRQWFGLL